jgi:L-fucose isomerase-like protein
LSSLHDAKTIDEQTFALIQELKNHGDFDIAVTSLDRLYSADLGLILVQSGGSEAIFLNLLPRLKPPYYLLTYGTNNSLAASMEILSYLKAKNKPAEILHGSTVSIARRLSELGNPKKEEPMRLGIVGKSSDWLIASKVDKKLCLDKLNIELVDIDIRELIDGQRTADLMLYRHHEPLVFDEFELNQAKKTVIALEKIVDKYRLQGLTVRCFDLLDAIHTTGCLGLSLLNKNGILAGCEGDVPALLSMAILRKILGQSAFQANPARIDVEKQRMVFAHCTLPFDMAENIRLMTHFESGIGVGLRGKMKETDVTLFKLGADLRQYYVQEGKIVANLTESNLCRTQIEVQLDDVRYFLRAPLGNHHLLVYGHHGEALRRWSEENLL